MVDDSEVRGGRDYFRTLSRCRLPARVEESKICQGSFVAFWQGEMICKDGRVIRFENEDAAWEHLARCAEATPGE